MVIATFQWATPLAPKRNVFLKNGINNFCSHPKYNQKLLIRFVTKTLSCSAKGGGHWNVAWPLERRPTVPRIPEPVVRPDTEEVKLIFILLFFTLSFRETQCRLHAALCGRWATSSSSVPFTLLKREKITHVYFRC